MNTKRRHNYPKTRKPKDTSYARCNQLIDELDLPYIKKVWTKLGMYRGGKKLGTSPYVLRYIAHKHGWTRPASRAPIILKGVQRGNMDPSYYKGLDFSEELQISTNNEDLTNDNDRRRTHNLQ